MEKPVDYNPSLKKNYESVVSPQQKMMELLDNGIVQVL
jgi:hypothetical protein